ncbi:MAG TPA: antitoxin Xre/MbcA/ParS toxin-binding domain-containing protein [Silvibacterium sp.]|jgi:putative toxin-antitoxin system antitoxin component (TIGR02293 family)|nr:antitoxin Xre/MbcA/ParS toxin-binding domain-containing protein [Silvibacterium sp.]
MSISQIAEVLGGSKTFKHTVKSSGDLATSIRAGLPATIITVLADRLTLHRTEVARSLGIPQRTLTRRLSRGARLTTDESDRAARMARIIALTEEVLGSQEKASSWLRTPNRALGAKLPMDEIGTDPGYRSVEEVLYAIAYGMYS